MNTPPNYKSYTLEELRDAYAAIDKDAYPQRTALLIQEIRLRENVNISPDCLEGVDRNHKTIYVAPKGNWFKLHWKGQLPLGVSYWINVFAAGAALLLLTQYSFSLLADSHASAAFRGLFVIVFYILISGFSVWQLIGLYRSAGKHTSRGGSAAWAVAAKVMVVIGVGRYCYDMSQTGVPFILESGKLIAGISALPPMSIRLMNNGTEAELQGGLEYGTAEQLAGFLSKNISVKIIHLNSLGGRIAEAKKLASLVSKSNLTTYTKTQCASACPIVFLAGKERLLGDEATLGFHSASYGSVSGSEYAELNSGLIKQLKNADVPSWFVKKVSKVSANDVWNPSHEELLRAGIIDKVVDTGDYALSGVTDWLNPVGIDTALQKNELYKIINQFDETGFSKIYDIMSEGVRQGTPSNILSTAINQYLYGQRIAYYMQLGGDTEVIQYLRSQIEQMEYLQHSHPEKCASYTYPELFDQNSSIGIYDILTPELIEMEVNALISLIKSTSTENYIASEQEQNEMITSIVKKMIAADSSYADVLRNTKDYTSLPEKLCSVVIILNKEFTQLPKQQAGALLRSLF